MGQLEGGGEWANPSVHHSMSGIYNIGHYVVNDLESFELCYMAFSIDAFSGDRSSVNYS